MFDWLRRHDRVRTLVPQLVLLSLVTSLALNTTILIRERRAKQRTFRIQHELLSNLRKRLEVDRAGTLARTPEIVGKLVKVGLDPEKIGFHGADVEKAKATVKPFHRTLSWFEVFFLGKRSNKLSKEALEDEADKQWEKEMAALIQQLEDKDGVDY